MQGYLRRKAVSCLILAAAILAGAESNSADSEKKEAKTILVTIHFSESAAAPEELLHQVEITKVKSKLPVLTTRSQLPETVRNLVENSTSKVAPQAYGTMGQWPFTTKRALDRSKTAVPASVKKKELARGVGKLFTHFSDGWWYVCTASVIDKGLLVTAAHCVQNYGEGSSGTADKVLFLPMMNANDSWWSQKWAAGTLSNYPYGVWKGRAWTVPNVYADGTDVCAEDAEGIVCENDLAVIAVAPKSGVHIGKRIFPDTDPVYMSYQHHSDDYSYTPLAFAPQLTGAQIAQFGYPQAMDSGLRMIRTDSLGIQDTPSQVVIGSDQSGGSSGGPWFVNYGMEYASTNSEPADPNMGIMAVTSWGYADDTVKVQGASRFAKNTTFTDKSNIDALHEAVCTAYPTHCY